MGDTAFLSPVVARVRRPLGNVTNTPPPTPAASEAASTPPTPFSNLKLLVRVASEEQAIKPSRRELFKNENDLDNVYSDHNVYSDPKMCFDTSVYCDAKLYSEPKLKRSLSFESGSSRPLSRKDKSLGLLCDRFLSMFPSHVSSEERVELHLDDLAKQIGTERRRVYDIVNVLEALQMMTKAGKNVYAWHGISHQLSTLAWLRHLGLKLGMRQRYVDVVHQETKGFQIQEKNSGLRHEKHDLVMDDHSYDEVMEEDQQIMERLLTPELKKPTPERRTSLGMACQKFLMLLLVADENELQINLDLAAKVIHGANVSAGVLKTRIRRLYDIANILQSLKLICKTVFCDALGNRKPAFKYVGPTVSDIRVTKATLLGLPSLRQKHSLLAFGKSLADMPDEPPTRIRPRSGSRGAMGYAKFSSCILPLGPGHQPVVELEVDRQ